MDPQSAAVKADRAHIAKLEAETKALRLETTELRTKASNFLLSHGALASSHSLTVDERQGSCSS